MKYLREINERYGSKDFLVLTYAPVSSFIEKETILNLQLLKSKIEKLTWVDSVITIIDAKTKLQEYSLKNFKKLPIYRLISNTGPRHKPIIKVSVKLSDGKIYYGEGNSKKNAEQKAATLCLDNLG